MADEKKNDAPLDLAGLIENAFLMGIGVLDMTKEKTEGFTAELIERGKMSQVRRQEGRRPDQRDGRQAAGGGPQDRREGDATGHEDRRRRHQGRGRRAQGADRGAQGDARSQGGGPKPPAGRRRR